MNFETQPNWEVDNTVVNAAFGTPGIRSFHLVKLTYNMFVFLVDVTSEDEMKLTNRYFSGDAQQAIELTSHEGVGNSKIALLFPRNKHDGQYQVSDVTEIERGKDTEGQVAYIYRCSDDQEYIDSYLGYSRSDLTEIETIYSGEKG